MGLLERIAAAARTETRMTVDEYGATYFPGGTFGYGGTQYAYGYGAGSNVVPGFRAAEAAGATLPYHFAAVAACPPAFAAQMVRSATLSQARFTFRGRPGSSKPRRTFGTRSLSVLENPAPSMTTGELLSRMEWHAGLAGNAYVYRQPDQLRVLRPDWVACVFGSDSEPDEAMWALDSQLLGYVYQNGGLFSGTGKPRTLLPDEVAHWAPLPDPTNAHIGMSWVTPALRDMQGDAAATAHKVMFFRNGATVGLVVKGITAPNGQELTKPQFDAIVDMMEARHAGVGNSYRTLYLTAGADASVLGANMQQVDFKATVGSGETRVAFLSRVPAPLLGISEGLAGSSLNAGNFGMARRMYADSWVYPTLQDLAGALSTIVDVPDDAELWPDTADMPILREDAKDAAEIQQILATTINGYVREGFTPDSAVAAVVGQDPKLLVHTGNLSVQLQPGGIAPPKDTPALPSAETPALPAGPAADGAQRDVDPATEERAGGNDEALHHYWTTGEGLARWRGSPHPWTTLVGLLMSKKISRRRAEQMASRWHIEVFGYATGSDKARVAHGKPPRGDKVGPG